MPQNSNQIHVSHEYHNTNCIETADMNEAFTFGEL